MSAQVPARKDAPTFYSDHDGETMYGLRGHFVIRHDDVWIENCRVLSLHRESGRGLMIRGCHLGSEPPWDPDDLPSTLDPGVVTDPKEDE